jgi:predicted acyl esterase
MGRRLVGSGAIAATVGLAAIVGVSTASANPLPPKGLTVPGAMAAPAPEPAPAVPTFVNGLAQNVFSATTSDWVRGEVWVEAPFDTDGDGKLDRMHADYTLPKETVTDGLKVPIIFEDSPYFAGTASSYSNWPMTYDFGQTPAFDSRPLAPFFNGTNTSPIISTEFDSTWLPRGFGVVHSESPGTGYSTGCPTSGGRNETIGATVIIDWLNGRAKAYTSEFGDTLAAAPTWTTGKVGMMGTSYNGTIPEAAATTGVQGLEAIVPISAISDWYNYYRANGAVRAPNSQTGGTGTNSYYGEDLDVLVDDVYSRRDENAAHDRTICRPELRQIGLDEHRDTGDRSAFWDERDYMKDVGNVHAAALIAHGNNDFNVMTKNASDFYLALKAQGVPHEFYFHQGGHGGAPPDVLVNRWFTRYLYGVQNGVENMPKSYVVREAATCPPRQTTVTGDQSNTVTLTVADTSPFPIGYTLTVPQTNASGTITSTTRVITNIPDSTHLTLASAVATTAGQKVANGTIVNLVCGTANPTSYSEWPDPASAPVTERLLPQKSQSDSGTTRGNMTLGTAGSAQETLTDDSAIADTALVNALPTDKVGGTGPTATNNVQDSRLVYQTNPLSSDVRISGTPSVTLKMAFSAPQDNLSAALVSYPAGTGAGTILTRGWLDPTNRNSDYVTDPITPATFYTLHFDMQAKDAIVPAGRRLGLVVFSTDRQYTIRVPAGRKLTLDLSGSSITIPIVGGESALAAATDTSEVGSTPSGTVPATLSLTLGTPAAFGGFTPGLTKDYAAQMTANVISTAGDGALSVADPSATATGHLVNGAFSLPSVLQAKASSAAGVGSAFANVGGSAAPTLLLTYSGPTSNDAVTVAFQQHIGSTDALRTGSYSKTLTFTLSTTTP